MKLNFSAIPVTLDAAAGDDARRSITGLAVPWGKPARVSTGQNVQFARGAFDVNAKAAKLIANHDLTQLLGVVSELVDMEEGLAFTAQFANTVAANDSVELIRAGALDAVSVGADVLEHRMLPGGVMEVTAARLVELSLVAIPAFEDATIDSLAASHNIEESPNNVGDEIATSTENGDSEMSENIEQVETVEAAPIHATAKRPARQVSAAEYVAGLITGNPSPEVAATIAENVVSDIPGAVPEELIGSVFAVYPEARPVTSALGTFAMPLGETFYRRKLVQPTLVAQQLAEFDELASQKMEIDRVQVDKKTFGGVLDVSEQSTLFSDIALVSQTVNDMAYRYLRVTEQYLLTFMEATAGAATAQVSDWLDGDEVIEDLYATAAEIKADFGELPSHLVITSATWAKLGAAKDSGGNRIFPFLAPSNAAGTFNGVVSQTGNPLGLALVVSDDIAAEAVMFNRRAIEAYEDIRGALRVEQPATLSTRLAYRGLFACADMGLPDGAKTFGAPVL
jgi:HK97 family phage prohead protease